MFLRGKNQYCVITNWLMWHFLTDCWGQPETCRIKLSSFKIRGLRNREFHFKLTDGVSFVKTQSCRQVYMVCHHSVCSPACFACSPLDQWLTHHTMIRNNSFSHSNLFAGHQVGTREKSTKWNQLENRATCPLLSATHQPVNTDEFMHFWRLARWPCVWQSWPPANKPFHSPPKRTAEPTDLSKNYKKLISWQID